MFGRRVHRDEALAEEHDVDAGVLEVGHHLGRAIAVKAQALDAVALGELDHHPLDVVEVGGTPLGQVQVPVARPGRVGDAVALLADDGALLGAPEEGQDGVAVVGKHQHETGQVLRAGEVQARVALPAFERRRELVEAPPAATGLPLAHVEGRDVRVRLDVEVEAQERVEVRGRLLGAGALPLQVVLLDGHPEVGVGLEPRARVVPGVLDRCLVDHGQERRVGERPVADLLRVLVLLVADRDALVVRRRDVDGQRLAAGAGTGLEHVHEVARRVRVELVDHGPVHREAVLGLGIGRQRPEDRARFPHLDRLEGSVDARACGELRALGHHLHGVPEDQGGLGLLGRGAVDLAARLAVAEQQVEREPRGEARLPVLAGDEHQRLAVAPKARAAVHPAEQVPDDRSLPGLEVERLAGALALHEHEHVVEEGDRAAREGHLEAMAWPGRGPRVVAGDPRAADLLEGRVAPARDRERVVVRSHQPTLTGWK